MTAKEMEKWVEQDECPIYILKYILRQNTRDAISQKCADHPHAPATDVIRWFIQTGQMDEILKKLTP
jgi:hypothetical protein